jgi:SAM-dependent methyltransferase
MGPSCVDEGYFTYLSGRSLLALLYRRHFLYPRLRRYLVGRVLDVGCGIGDFLNFYRNAVGVDINPFAVEYCRRQGLEAYQAEAGRFPLESRAFDSAILDNVIEHLEDPAPILKEVLRVLRPRGRILVGIPGRRGYEVDPSHRLFYDAEALAAYMLTNGCMKQRIFGAPFRSRWLDRRMPQYCIYGVFDAPPSAKS